MLLNVIIFEKNEFTPSPSILYFKQANGSLYNFSWQMTFCDISGTHIDSVVGYVRMALLFSAQRNSSWKSYYNSYFLSFATSRKTPYLVLMMCAIKEMEKLSFLLKSFTCLPKKLIKIEQILKNFQFKKTTKIFFCSYHLFSLFSIYISLCFHSPTEP